MKRPDPLVWPDGTTSALAFSFDLDAHTMWTSRDALNFKRPAVMSQGEYDVGEGLWNVLDWLAQSGLSSTFFVPSDVAEVRPDAVRAIADHGHEIGCHGTDHVPVSPDLPRKDELALIRRATEILEDVTGKRPVGYRAPMYGVTASTWDILGELGYRYSSNLMDRTSPYLHDEHLAEVPIHWTLDDGLYFLVSYHPPNHRVPRSVREVAEIWVEELMGNSAAGRVTTLTLHPQLIGRPARLKVLQAVLTAAVECGGVWFPRMRDIADHILSTSADRDVETGRP